MPENELEQTAHFDRALRQLRATLPPAAVRRVLTHVLPMNGVEATIHRVRPLNTNGGRKRRARPPLEALGPEPEE